MRSAAIVSSLCGLVLVASGADPEQFRLWQTYGATGYGNAWGETIIEVEPVRGGTLLRGIYIGHVDTCGNVAIHVWEKRVPKKSPADLAVPARLCEATPEWITGVDSRHGVLSVRHEGDYSGIYVKCGGKSWVIAPDFTNDLGEHDPDAIRLGSLRELLPRLSASLKLFPAPQGLDYPSPKTLDAASAKAGEGYAKKLTIVDDRDYVLKRFLASYRGPMERPTESWRLELPPGVSIAKYVEPLGFPGLVFVGDRLTFRSTLTVDRITGRVKKTDVVGGSDVRTVGVDDTTSNWIFDPMTIPADGLVPITLRFTSTCKRPQ